ncbi:hypothetical protein [Antarctobacter heliothermus]|uniref:hypothetical protein n=1 Tax=Antarctobacter heliothermus TaxID=74033 RepID=UPI000B76C5D1|nr:hypothetical protein [Antarctobacter heliothermus]
MTEDFTFRLAPIGKTVTWRLEGDLLTGPQGTCDLTGIETANFVDTTVQLIRMRRLDLRGASGLCRISVNTRLGLPPDDPNRAAHRALCRRVSEHLSSRAPDLPVKIGEAGAIRALWFGIGVLSLVMGLGIGIAALATGVSSDRLLGMIVPVTLLALFGAVLMHRHALWRTPLEIPVSALPAIVDLLDLPKAPDQRV